MKPNFKYRVVAFLRQKVMDYQVETIGKTIIAVVFYQTITK